jgi:hypothetical protein
VGQDGLDRVRVVLDAQLVGDGEQRPCKHSPATYRAAHAATRPRSTPAGPRLASGAGNASLAKDSPSSQVDRHPLVAGHPEQTSGPRLVSSGNPPPHRPPARRGPTGAYHKRPRGRRLRVPVKRRSGWHPSCVRERQSSNSLSLRLPILK